MTINRYKIVSVTAAGKVSSKTILILLWSYDSISSPLITCRLDIALVLKGEISFWSLMREGLNTPGAMNYIYMYIYDLYIYVCKTQGLNFLRITQVINRAD